MANTLIFRYSFSAFSIICSAHLKLWIEILRILMYSFIIIMQIMFTHHQLPCPYRRWHILCPVDQHHWCLQHWNRFEMKKILWRIYTANSFVYPWLPLNNQLLSFDGERKNGTKFKNTLSIIETIDSSTKSHNRTGNSTIRITIYWITIGLSWERKCFITVLHTQVLTMLQSVWQLALDKYERTTSISFYMLWI